MESYHLFKKKFCTNTTYKSIFTKSKTNTKKIVSFTNNLTTRWPAKDAKVAVFHKVKKSNLTHKGDDFCGIFAFYNTSIISAAIYMFFKFVKLL